MTEVKEAVKNDAGKIDLTFLTPYASSLKSLVFQFGAKKYSRGNFLLGGKSWTHLRLCGAAMRHIFQHMWGTSLDTESNLPHLAHAACCIDMLMECWVKGDLVDDRVRTLVPHGDVFEKTTSFVGLLKENEGKKETTHDVPRKPPVEWA
jgi:hypothetical protein